MEQKFYDEQFELRALEPKIWALTARRLKLAADMIFNAYSKDCEKFIQGISPSELPNLELAGSATMLYGLALENIIKAIYIDENPEVVENGRLIKWHGGGHNQIAIIQDTSVSLDTQQNDLVKRMSAFVVWAGRYPIPMKSNAMSLKQRGIFPDFVPLPIQPNEQSAVDQLYKMLESRVLTD